MLTFTPKTAGYYAVKWTSTDGEERAHAIYRERGDDGVGGGPHDHRHRLLPRRRRRSDRRQGEHARGRDGNVLVVTPASGRWVMLSASADTILESRILHLDGTVKLVQLPSTTATRRTFLTASSVFDRQLATDTERGVVPPVEHFITVDVKPDRTDYDARQDGKLTITTRDADGKPVPAEVAVSLSDEAVTAIQNDPAGDPRQFFFGEMHQQRVHVTAGCTRSSTEGSKTSRKRPGMKKRAWRDTSKTALLGECRAAWWGACLAERGTLSASRSRSRRARRR